MIPTWFNAGRCVAMTSEASSEPDDDRCEAFQARLDAFHEQSNSALETLALDLGQDDDDDDNYDDARPGHDRPGPYAAIDPTLGLDLIQGPVTYMFLEPLLPKLPAIVLLADVHEDVFCAKTCAKRCVSASAQDRANTFLAYLDATYGPLQPDVFLEAWEPKAQRTGTVPRKHEWQMVGPIQGFTLAALPCAYPDRVAIIGGSAVGCAYPSLRVHFADARDVGCEASKVMTFRLAPEDARKRVGVLYPGCDPMDALLSEFSQDPLKYFDDPVCRATSRVSRELHQLPEPVLQRLKAGVVATGAKCCRGEDDTLFGPEDEAFVMACLQRYLDGTVRELDPTVERMLEQFVASADYLYNSMVGMDLYAVARALKKNAAGKHRALCVMYFGGAHVIDIAHMLTASALYRIARAENDEGHDRCVVLNPDVVLADVVGTVDRNAPPPSSVLGPGADFARVRPIAHYVLGTRYEDFVSYFVRGHLRPYASRAIEVLAGALLFGLSDKVKGRGHGVVVDRTSPRILATKLNALLEAGGDGAVAAIPIRATMPSEEPLQAFLERTRDFPPRVVAHLLSAFPEDALACESVTLDGVSFPSVGAYAKARGLHEVLRVLKARGIVACAPPPKRTAAVLEE